MLNRWIESFYFLLFTFFLLPDKKTAQSCITVLTGNGNSLPNLYFGGNCECFRRQWGKIHTPHTFAAVIHTRGMLWLFCIVDFSLWDIWDNKMLGNRKRKCVKLQRDTGQVKICKLGCVFLVSIHFKAVANGGQGHISLQDFHTGVSAHV